MKALQERSSVSHNALTSINISLHTQLNDLTAAAGGARAAADGVGHDGQGPKRL